MTVDKEADLGLSLSINLTQNKAEKQQHEYHLQHQHQQQKQKQKQQEYRNQMQAQNVNNLFPNFFNSGLQQNASWNPFSSASGVDQTHTYSMMRPSSETRTHKAKAFIDVNRLPTIEDYTYNDAGASSPNSTISSQSGKRSEREADHPVCSGSDDEDGDNSRKKLRLSKDQSVILEETFKNHSTLNPKQKMALAKQLGLRPRQVEVWFQNRRARTKLKQTEVDCEFLKRCCENLTDENRRLQKEVQELRALKMSPQFYMQMTPPTTLTMCPSCERVGGQSLSNQTSRPKSHENHWALAARSFDAMIRPRS